ncbi:MAG: glycoside hydrolase family 16 protein [Acidobacteriota bacterium]
MKHKEYVKMWTERYVFVALFVSLALPVLGQSKNRVKRNPNPSIAITRVPSKGAGPDRMEPIAGTVDGVNAKDCRVVVFARTNTWYVQPYAASPYTTISNDRKWETDTHLGDEYAALLVKSSYNPPATTDTLPEVAGDVLAIVRVSAKAQSALNSVPSASTSAESTNAHMRTLQFSGYEWKVKSSSGQVGPGPNYFSDSKNNVEVDAQGRLHLRITKRDGRWHCAEVISTRSFGYGTYRFYVDTNIDKMDPRVVLGLFTWSDAPDYSNREIDVEVSSWGKKDNKNGQFVVQPYTRPMNIVRFQIPRGLRASTHSFAWKPDSIFCQSLKGSHAATARRSLVIAEHAFTQGIPQAGGENARINLWLMNGHPLIGGKETEIIVSKFEFVPSPD